MRIAVISDVHGNLHALERVLEAVAEERADATWCLGDTVGYGPRPNECCALVERTVALCLAGNHDLLALGREVLADDFNPDAAAAGAWTRSMLRSSSAAFLGGLGSELHVDEADLYHGSARDPVWEYVLSDVTARATFALSGAALVLVGHSHVPLWFRDGDPDGRHAPEGTELDLAQGRWLLNPGSVGQPRDGDPRAAWLLLDLGARRATFHRVGYDVASTQADMRELGLPEPLAERLLYGF